MLREPHEHEITQIDGARLIPLGELPDRLGELDDHAEIVTHATTGPLTQGVEILRAAGFSKVRACGVDRCMGR